MNISRKPNTDQYEAVVIGVSAGGISALGKILPQLDKAFSLPVLIVQHIGQQAD
ncbi:MAG: chemotaxis protein CheB, partial [Desulfobulbaceae bacterium]